MENCGHFDNLSHLIRRQGRCKSLKVGEQREFGMFHIVWYDRSKEGKGRIEERCDEGGRKKPDHEGVPGMQPSETER